MFEFRLRILDVGEGSFLRIVEGFPEILAHATTIEQTERDLVNALIEHFERLQDHESTRIQLDDFPTVHVIALCVSPRLV
jgi:predicted RNase H-like HicB family nuclease